MSSDWTDGHGPGDHDQRHEAARLISQAKALIDDAKSALYRSRTAKRGLDRNRGRSRFVD